MFFLLFQQNVPVQTRMTSIESKCCEPILAHIWVQRESDSVKCVPKNQFRHDSGESLNMKLNHFTWQSKNGWKMIMKLCFLHVYGRVCFISIFRCAVQKCRSNDVCTNLWCIVCFLWSTCESSSTLFAPPHICFMSAHK